MIRNILLVRCIVLFIGRNDQCNWIALDGKVRAVDGCFTDTITYDLFCWRYEPETTSYSWGQSFIISSPPKLDQNAPPLLSHLLQIKANQTWVHKVWSSLFLYKHHSYSQLYKVHKYRTANKIIPKGRGVRQKIDHIRDIKTVDEY